MHKTKNKNNIKYKKIKKNLYEISNIKLYSEFLYKNKRKKNKKIKFLLNIC